MIFRGEKGGRESYTPRTLVTIQFDNYGINVVGNETHYLTQIQTSFDNYGINVVGNETHYLTQIQTSFDIYGIMKCS